MHPARPQHPSILPAKLSTDIKMALPISNKLRLSGYFILAAKKSYSAILCTVNFFWGT